MTTPSPTEWFEFAINTLKGEYPEDQWPEYNVPQMEAALTQLNTTLIGMTDNVRELIDVHARKEATYKELLTLCLTYLQPCSRDADPTRYEARKRELIKALEALTQSNR